MQGFFPPVSFMALPINALRRFRLLRSIPGPGFSVERSRYTTLPAGRDGSDHDPAWVELDM
nr:hypothetical protein [Prosthecochloris ethylica]